MQVAKMPCNQAPQNVCVRVFCGVVKRWVIGAAVKEFDLLFKRVRLTVVYRTSREARS